MTAIINHERTGVVQKGQGWGGTGDLGGTLAAMSIRTNMRDELSVAPGGEWGDCKIDSCPEALVCWGLVEGKEEIAEIGSGIADCFLTTVVSS
jgi:hypothetical protein